MTTTMRQTNLPTRQQWQSRLFALILILAAATAFPALSRAEANAGRSGGTPRKVTQATYALRYICFVAAPRQAGAFAAKEMPPVLRGLQAGSDAALDPTPQAFLHRLSAADTRLFYRLILSGEAAFASSAATDAPPVAAVQASMDPRDPSSAVAVEEQIEIMLDESGDGTLTLRRTGALMRRTAKNSGQETVRWKGAVKRSVVPGRTYSHIMAKLPTGERLIYAYTVVETGR